MILVICADDRDGILFNNRRLSRDSALCAHILEHCGENVLWMNNYSASIFPQNTPNIRISENFLEEAGAGELCFVENTDFSRIYPQAEKIILYRWNRSYPADRKLPADFLTGRKQSSTLDLAGNSHPCITQEVYEL